MSWLTLSVQAAIGAGKLTFEEKPVSTEGCHYDFIPRIVPVALSFLSEDEKLKAGENDLPMFYQLSYLWYTLIGLIVSCAVGLIAAFVGLGQGPLDPRDVDPALLAPVVRRFIKPREFPNQPQGDEIILAYEPVRFDIFFCIFFLTNYICNFRKRIRLVQYLHRIIVFQHIKVIRQLHNISF